MKSLDRPRNLFVLTLLLAVVSLIYQYGQLNQRVTHLETPCAAKP